MTLTINPWPSVLICCGAADEGGGQTCYAAEGAKNLWVRTGHHWNLNLATFNTGTLSSKASLAGIFEELSGIARDITDVSKVRRTGEAYTVLTSGHVLCYRRLPDKKEYGVGLLIHKDIALSIDEFTALMRG